MAYLIGAILAVTVGGIASLLRLDRDRAFYPTVLIVIVSCYAVFAVMGGSGRALALEVTIITGFLVVSAVGFRRSRWVVVAQFCLTFDVVAAGCLASLLLRHAVPAHALTTLLLAAGMSAAYHLPPRCCDIPSDVYSADGSIICHADGGFDGAGDGRCSDFFSSRKNEKIIWRDPRAAA